jgi:hypothetical protein
VIGAPTSRWTAKFDTWLGTRQEMACYRAVMGYLQGRANTILISPCEWASSPAVLAGGSAVVTAPFGQTSSQTPTATFSDTSLFEQDGTYAYLMGAQNQMDTSFFIQCFPAPLVGTFFSITPDFVENSFLHLITSLGQVGDPWSSGFSSGFGPNTIYSVQIEPPLRKAYLPGARLSFGRPLCRMRLTSDTAGEFVRMRSAESKPSLQFVEVF